METNQFISGPDTNRDQNPQDGSTPRDDKPRDFKVLKMLTDKKHAIYLVNSESFKSKFALKMFPFIDGR